MSEILDSEPAQGLGYSTVLASVCMWLLEELDKITVHDAIQILVGIGGLAFIFYKVWTQILKLKSERIDLKNKQLDNKIKKRTLKELDNGKQNK